MSRLVIIVLKPKKDRKDELIALLKKSFAVIQKLGLATSREQYLAACEDDTILQVFEWVSDTSQNSAGEHEEIRELWMEAERLSTFMKPSAVKEFNEVFP